MQLKASTMIFFCWFLWNLIYTNTFHQELVKVCFVYRNGIIGENFVVGKSNKISEKRFQLIMQSDKSIFELIRWVDPHSDRWLEMYSILIFFLFSYINNSIKNLFEFWFCCFDKICWLACGFGKIQISK